MSQPGTDRTAIWSLAVHGGAGMLTPDTVSAGQQAGARAGLSHALDRGSAVLAEGGSALDAVAAAVVVLEDDPHFNAGRGAALSYEGTISLDAAMMEGQHCAAGAVAGVCSTRNPILLARAVMTSSPHVLLSGPGADSFSREQGLEQANIDWFATPERRAQLEAIKARGAGWFDVDMKYGTVGAVACDILGHVAAATSTGGVTGKRWGRIGDTPLPGAGTWADDRACAISCTGAGEFFIRAGVGHEIAARVRLTGCSLGEAARAVLAEVGEMGGTGGVIMAAPGGELGWHFTTPGMYRGCASSTGGQRIDIFTE